MCSNLFDPDTILSENEEWNQLDEKWGKPIDLDTDEDYSSTLKPVFSNLDLLKTTFDSSFLFKKVRRKFRRQQSDGVLDYTDFMQNLRESETQKQFYFTNGQILSATSVEEICDKIDDIFRSIEMLCSATSTIRRELPDVVGCSFSIGDLSFDDTVSEEVKNDSDDIDVYIDEAFEKLGHLSAMTADDDNDATRVSVTTLVRKFSSILSNPAVNCSPRRQRQCCSRFRELAEFWNNNAPDQVV